MTPDQLAGETARVLWADDTASQELGMKIESVGPGCARLSMEVGAHMLNGHKTCHGGYIFTLADSAFAFACNSFNRRAVAHNCSIFYLRPGAQGDRLTADARRRAQFGRNGIYDVKVTNQNQDTIAEFRGCSREIGGVHVELPEDE